MSAPADSEPGTPLARTETRVDPTARLRPGTIVAGRYCIVSPCGVGGMGLVYRARDEELGVDVALKVLRVDLANDARWLERFRQEVLLARRVSHANVVRIHDIGESGDFRFLTMRFVEGRSLREILREEGALPFERALSILSQVAEGLAAAHAAGVIHRDLKPGNILVDPEGTVFITDFGIARSGAGSGLTQEGVILGTPDYLSPEQVAGEPVDGRADLFALGIVFYEILTNELPFRSTTQAEAVAQRLTGRARTLEAAGVRVPRRAQAILNRCLQRSPRRRYPDARALLADLHDVEAGRRKPWLGRAAIAAALLALLSIAGVLLNRRGAAPRAVSPNSSSKVSAPTPRHAVAILPLANDTGDPSLAWSSTGFAEMLSARLAEDPSLRVVDSLRILMDLRDLKLDASRLDERAQRQLVEIWGVDVLGTGSLRRAGGTLSGDVRLSIVGEAGAVLTKSISAEAQGPEGIFRLSVTLGERLREALGAHAPQPVEPPSPGTVSLDAERAYEEGRGLLLAGDEIRAVPALERAVAADPGFTAALERLSGTYQSLGRLDKAAAAAERALAAVGSAPTRTGSRARARAALLKGDAAEAEKAYRELLSRYPLDTETWIDLAGAQAAQGHHAAAVDSLKSVVALDPNDARAWYLLGRNSILTGESARAAQDYLVRALAGHTRLGNEKGRADVLNALGAAHQQLGDGVRALAYYTEALAARRKLGDDRGVASTLRNRALLERNAGKGAEAETDLSEAQRILEKLGDSRGLSDTMNDFGMLEEGRGAYGKALKAYQSALKIRRDLGDEQLLAESYDNVGYIYYLQGEYDNANVYWGQALALRRKIGEKSGILLSAQNLGFLETAQGKLDAAVASFAEALRLARETDNKEVMAVALGNLGVIAGYQGRPSAALDSLREALAMAIALDAKLILTEFTLKEGELLLELGRPEEAASRAEAASKWVKSTGNREHEADLEILRGRILLARRETDAARAAFQRAVKAATDSGSRVARLKARIESARVPMARGDGRTAAAALGPALEEAETIGHAALTLEAAEALAHALLAAGRLPQAERAAQRAVQVAEKSGFSARLASVQDLLARTRGPAR